MRLQSSVKRDIEMEMDMEMEIERKRERVRRVEREREVKTIQYDKGGDVSILECTME